MAKKRKSKYDSISNAKKAADSAFSDYIRARDGYTCFTSGKKGDRHNIDAGHFLSRRYMDIRYDERNCHAQSKHDNIFLGGNWDIYMERMIEKYGKEVVDELMSRRYIECKRTIEDYLEIEKYFRQKLRDLEEL